MSATQSSSKMLRIGQAANYLKVSEKTLRRWEDHGIISPTRNPQNQRLYSLNTLKQLKKRKYRPLPQKASPQKKLYSMSEAASSLKVSLKTLRRWDKSGKIESERNKRNQRVFTYQAIQLAKQNQMDQLSPPPTYHIPLPTTASPKQYPPTPSYRPAFTIVILIIFSLFGFAYLSSNHQKNTRVASKLSSIPESHLNHVSQQHNLPESLALTSDGQDDLSTSPDIYDSEIAQINDFNPSSDLNYIPPAQSSTLKLDSDPTKIQTDIEITKPMTTNDLITFINHTNSYNNSLADIGQDYSTTKSDNTIPSISVYSLYSDYTKLLPLLDSTTPSQLIATFTSPSGEKITRRAIIDTESQSFLIKFIPDQVGTWFVNWTYPTLKLNGSDTFQVIQN